MCSNEGLFLKFQGLIQIYFLLAQKQKEYLCKQPSTPRIFKRLCLYLVLMHVEKIATLLKETLNIKSEWLQRTVVADCYLPNGIKDAAQLSLLLINDGQDMEKLGLATMLEEMVASNEIAPVFCVAIHAGPERKMEYGTAITPDYLQRGALAKKYTQFIFEELLPLIRSTYQIPSFKDKSFAGFSLGGLSALDIVWNHPHEFVNVGVFSGSLWWRTKSLDDNYNEDTDRIMHAQVRNGQYHPWLRFFFETGTLDETMDRNKNGIIDSIDDTLSLIDELAAKGYNKKENIYYLELPDGMHDVATWARAMPVFLKWCWGK
jgi:enterochelin esterase-like enzyme